MSIRAWVGGVVGLVVLSGAVILLTERGGYRSSDTQQENHIEAPVRAAPPFELKTSQGKVHRLADFRGNAVVLHFWASWCPPCLKEIPGWLEFAARWKGKPVRFVAISLDNSWAEALKILPDQKLPENAVSVLDEAQKFPDLYGTYQFPETYLLNRDLNIVSKWVGPQDWNQQTIVSAVENAMGQGR